MTLQQLIYAVEVFRAGSINRAAQKLYVAQPNLSSSIRNLEKEINITLFHRTRKGIEPTRDGEQFIMRAMELTSQFDALKNLYTGSESGLFSLSITMARSSEFSNCIASYLNTFSMADLPSRIHLREATNSEVIEDVSTGKADLGIICPNSLTAQMYFQDAYARGLNAIRLKPKKYCLLFSENHPLAQEKHITSDMLTSYTEVVHADYDMPLYPTSDYRRTDSSDESSMKRHVIFIYERGTLMEVLSNVKGSYLWSTTTSSRLLEAYHLVERPCDAPTVEGIDAIVYNRNVPLSKDVQKLIRVIESYDEKNFNHNKIYSK